MANRATKALFILIGTCLLSSCMNTTDISMTDVDPLGWQQGRYAEVIYTNTDTVTVKNIEIVVRLNHDFDYDKLGLEICTITPKGHSWRDTIHIPVNKPENIYHTFYEQQQTYRSEVTFNNSGRYRFRISPVMPRKKISGINAVGVNIH